ncbi:DUF1499 domain-containing protein [Roseobacteraceae bacterium S113]
MRWSMWVILAAVLGFAAWVRLAPSDAARWHVALGFEGDGNQVNGAQRVLPGDAALFEALDGIIRATPRTQVLAGDAAQGHITYVTRSALWGFPDYTTVQSDGDHIRIWGRLRFGRADLAVNATRIDGWLQALRQR